MKRSEFSPPPARRRTSWCCRPRRRCEPLRQGPRRAAADEVVAIGTFDLLAQLEVRRRRGQIDDPPALVLLQRHRVARSIDHLRRSAVLANAGAEGAAIAA